MRLMKYVDVIVPLPLEGTFTYAVPQHLVNKIQFGVRVAVTFGTSKVHTAIVVSVHDKTPNFRVKPIVDVIDSHPMLLQQQYQLWRWISAYYMAPLGDIYNAALPAGLKIEENYRPRMEIYIDLCKEYRTKQALNLAFDLLRRAQNQKEVLTHFLRISHWDKIQKDETQQQVVDITREELMNVAHCSYAVIKKLVERKILFTYEREVGRLTHLGEEHLERIKLLNEAQQEAYNKIVFQFLNKKVVLLHGVTSSGKTEIYIHLIKKAIEEKKQVLYLLPEIALTVQITSRLKHVFGNKLGIYHSKYSDAERVEIWKKQLSAHPYDIILGARSAVFLPFQQLGLVIIDEEHETSFKQQEPVPRYHARSVAIVLAQMYEANTLLGTATPSAESYYNATIGKYGLVSLSTRYKGIELPEIQIVDIKDLRRRKMMTGPFSPTLIAAINEALKNNQQVILFQNRRGFAPMVECRTCGWIPKCTNCDVSLTMHKNMNLLTCHYCGYTYQIPTLCPACGATDLRSKGYGTEKIEEYVNQLFPDARIARMDLDTTRTRNAYERLIDDFSCGNTNLLIGTQMVSKGLDFDRVSVVGILDADTMLNYPDFRAYEYAFMMMAQVSGRAGRKGQRGRVLLQTKNKDLPVIQQIVKNDYASFFKALLDERKLFSYPPFYHLVYVFLRHRKENMVETAAIELGCRLRKVFGERVLGPDKPSIARIKNMYIRKMVIKLENGISQQVVRQYLKTAQQQLLQDKQYAALQIYYDVDPV